MAYRKQAYFESIQDRVHVNRSLPSLEIDGIPVNQVSTVAQKCKTQNKQSKTKITFLYYFYTILKHFYPKHETQLTILSTIFSSVTRLKTQNTFGNHKTHLEITKHIWKSQNTFRNHKTHLESQNTFRNHKTHLESQNTFRNHKTHLESQNTFRNHKTHLEIGNSES